MLAGKYARRCVRKNLKDDSHQVEDETENGIKHQLFNVPFLRCIDDLRNIELNIRN